MSAPLTDPYLPAPARYYPELPQLQKSFDNGEIVQVAAADLAALMAGPGSPGYYKAYQRCYEALAHVGEEDESLCGWRHDMEDAD